jgi:hypothetical protein
MLIAFTMKLQLQRLIMDELLKQFQIEFKEFYEHNNYSSKIKDCNVIETVKISGN